MERTEQNAAQGKRVRYRALDAQGVARHGEIDAIDEAGAARELLDKGWTPLHLESLNARFMRNPLGRRAVTAEDRRVFLQELGTLLQAGISANEALPSLAQAYQGQALGKAAARLDAEVRAGRSIAQSMASCGLGLPPFAQALVDAGDASGRLGDACEDAAAQMEHDQRIRSELRNALIYPCILVAAGSLALLIILIGVVPRFAGVLRNPRADVPPMSRWVIEAGLFLQQHWLGLGIGLAIAMLLLALLLRTPGVLPRLQAWLASLPGLGPWLIEAETGRWAQLLGALLANRVPIIKALQLAGGVLGLAPLRQALTRAARDLEGGASLTDILTREAWFPPTRLNLIRVGERSGELAAMLQRLGNMQIEAARLRQKRLLALVEPVAILVIGAVIGFIMAAVLMAITSLNTAAT